VVAPTEAEFAESDPVHTNVMGVLDAEFAPTTIAIVLVPLTVEEVTASVPPLFAVHPPASVPATDHTPASFPNALKVKVPPPMKAAVGVAFNVTVVGVSDTIEVETSPSIAVSGVTVSYVLADDTAASTDDTAVLTIEVIELGCTANSLVVVHVNTICAWLSPELAPLIVNVIVSAARAAVDITAVVSAAVFDPDIPQPLRVPVAAHGDAPAEVTVTVVGATVCETSGVKLNTMLIGFVPSLPNVATCVAATVREPWPFTVVKPAPCATFCASFVLTAAHVVAVLAVAEFGNSDPAQVNEIAIPAAALFWITITMVSLPLTVEDVTASAPPLLAVQPPERVPVVDHMLVLPNAVNVKVPPLMNAVVGVAFSSIVAAVAPITFVETSPSIAVSGVTVLYVAGPLGCCSTDDTAVFEITVAAAGCTASSLEVLHVKIISA
tara:strand:+ start:4045 stop:5358 length:1314 start_codon:yes stop_codon:yes gene_type:complete